ERLLGNERRRTCPKPCTQDKDCGNKRQCLCDGQCALRCVAPGTCVWNNFVASLLSPTPSFSALLEVRCDTGYMLPNGLDTAIRRCQGDQQWSGDDPNCTGGYKNRFISLSPSLSLSLSLYLSLSLSLTFSPSLSLSLILSLTPPSLSRELMGNSENLCNIDQTWRYPHPICQRVWCPPPQEWTEYDVGNAIYYLCKKNHLLDGSNRVTCQPNGTWTRCPIPAERSRVLIGGLKRWPYDVTDSVVPHGESVTFYCKHSRKQYVLILSTFDVTCLSPPSFCVPEPTWLQYKLFSHWLVSEIEACSLVDLE
uniref:Beta-2-glycoprotein 1 n=1 Tax=Hucho hucho TaxID=62062 RepID=A0A4W5QE34_9TELE